MSKDVWIYIEGILAHTHKFGDNVNEIWKWHKTA